ncbi:MAG: type II toxin-antitoxin system RelE/ParE family toxin [bacterium]
MPEAKLRELHDYEKPDGSKPFRQWFDHLVETDPVAAAKIGAYLGRLKLGNLGNAKLLPGCEGVWELVMDFGPGWRVYFGQSGAVIFLLLTGGNKRSQRQDIDEAVKYWREFKLRNGGKP